MRPSLKLRSVYVEGDPQGLPPRVGEIGHGAVSHRAVSDRADRKLSRALVTLRIFSAPLRLLRKPLSAEG